MGRSLGAPDADLRAARHRRPGAGPPGEAPDPRAALRPRVGAARSQGDADAPRAYGEGAGQGDARPLPRQVRARRARGCGVRHPGAADAPRPPTSGRAPAEHDPGRPGHQGRGAAPGRGLRRARGELPVPPPRVGGAAALRRPAVGHPRARRAHPRASRQELRLCLAQRVPGRLSAKDRLDSCALRPDRGGRMSARLFVLDGPGFLYRAYHAIPYLSTSKGVPCHAVFGMSTMLWKLLREETPEFFAVAWDPPGPTFREAQFAAYKETRPGMPDDLSSQIPYVKTLFEALRLPLLEIPGFEADDVLGTVVDRARAMDLDVVLVTADKDMLQLVAPRVRVLSTTGRGDRVVFDEAAVKEKWGVEPAQIPDLLALMGDSIDNIPGVRGVGEKTAVKLIAQFGTVERLYENLHLVPGKLRETLAASRKEALLSRELATVSTRVPIAVDLDALKRREPDWERLRALWSELEFHSLLRQIPAEARPESPPDQTPRLESPAALAGYLAKVPTGVPLAVEWVGQGT